MATLNVLDDSYERMTPFVLWFIFNRNLSCVTENCYPCVTEIAIEKRRGRSDTHLTCGTYNLETSFIRGSSNKL